MFSPVCLSTRESVEDIKMSQTNAFCQVFKESQLLYFANVFVFLSNFVG